MSDEAERCSRATGGRADKAREDELTGLRGSGHGGGRADSTLLPRWQQRLLTRRPGVSRRELGSGSPGDKHFTFVAFQLTKPRRR